MNPLRTIWSRLRPLGQRSHLKREIDDELRFHLEQRTAENIAAGMTPDEAARAARKRFGNVQTVREECRETRGAGFGEATWQDVHFGLRMLRNNPGFTAVAALTLALGIGASTAIYSVINSILLNPLPGPATDRLVQIAERQYFQGGFHEQNGKPMFNGVSPPSLDALIENRQFFADFAWADGMTLERKTDDFTEEDGGNMVSPSFFALLNVPPLLGRTFAQDEAVPMNTLDIPVRDTVIVLSYSYWQALFGGDTKAIGKTIELSGRHFTIIGVMPRYFQFPWGGTKYWIAAEPLRLPPGWGRAPNTQVYARLKPAGAIAQTEAMLDTVAKRLIQDQDPKKSYGREWNRIPGGFGFWVRPAREHFTDGRDDLRRTLFGLLAAIGFVMMIVCANLANLTLARTEKRQQELALRAALGAGRLRLMRQLLAENVLLACLGGIGAVAVAAAGVKLLTALVPEYMPRLKDVQIDGHALGFTLLVSVATGLLFGCAPAWQAGRANLGEALKQAGVKATPGHGRRLYRGALVVVQVALTLVLLAGTGLMLDSVVRLLHVDPGFDPQNLIRVDIELPWNRYNDQDSRERAAGLRRVLYDQLQAGLAALPGVTAVGIGKHGAWPVKLALEGHNEPVEALLDGCGVEKGDLFRAMGIPLRAGRLFDQHDLAGGAGTAIINETMARSFWTGEDPLGKKFTQDWIGSPQYEVVGVVGDIRDYSYDAPPKPTYYRPCHELALEGMRPFFVIRTQNDPRALVPAIRKELVACEPAMHTPEITICRQALYDSTVAQRTYLTFLAVFALAGLSLAALGIYGVLAYSVARRTREIGIRMALGAEQREVLFMIMGEGARLILIGLAMGLLAAFWLTRLLHSQLFEVHPGDPLVFFCAVLLLIVVALVACLLPAWHAIKIKPMEALRLE